MRQQPIWKLVLVGMVTFWSLLYSLPSIMGGVPAWWPGWLPSQVVHRGLDLQGGLYLLLHVQVDKAVEQRTENLVDEVRTKLKQEKVRYRNIERSGIDTVSVRALEGEGVASVRKALEGALEHVTLEELAATQEVRIVMTTQELLDIRKSAVQQSIQTLRSRIDQFGITEPSIQKQGEDRILVQMPGLRDPDRAKALIGRTARLEFKMVDEKGDLAAALQGQVPSGDVVLYGEGRDDGSVARGGAKGESRQPYLVKKRTVLAGDRLADARVSFSQYGEPYVSITFDSQGGRQFSQLTGEHVGERMAIVLDGKVHSAPVIREKIDGGKAQITGSFTPDEAHDLAIVLRAGALPAPVSIMEERTVGPTLGQDSIEEGLLATFVGGGLVLLFMLFNYKGFGIISNIAVIVNILIVVAVLAMLQATLTLPGIAGLVLLVGMAVDSNVLINERIREELKLGQSPLAAIERGYDKAFTTILDSNITTLITTAVLYQFGSGPVRGFAVTLSIGLLASMFTAVFMTRVILVQFLKNRRPRTLSI
jgi:preprotein translocase subunit SecD